MPWGYNPKMLNTLIVSAGSMSFASIRNTIISDDSDATSDWQPCRCQPSSQPIPAKPAGPVLRPSHLLRPAANHRPSCLLQSPSYQVRVPAFCFVSHRTINYMIQYNSNSTQLYIHLHHDHYRAYFSTSALFRESEAFMN